MTLKEILDGVYERQQEEGDTHDTIETLEWGYDRLLELAEAQAQLLERAVEKLKEYHHFQFMNIPHEDEDEIRHISVKLNSVAQLIHDIEGGE